MEETEAASMVEIEAVTRVVTPIESDEVDIVEAEGVFFYTLRNLFIIKF